MTKPSLVVIHGHTMNARVMREHLGPLHDEFETHVDVVYAEAPHECSEDMVDRLYALWNAPRLDPPYRTWWDATDDGREYRGLPESRAVLETLLVGPAPVALLGFSQGAIAATVLAALANAGEIRPVVLAILVAGRPPRAQTVLPYLSKPLAVPSLHVWGDRDPLASAAPDLADVYEPSLRRVVTFAGGHRVPTSGAAAAEIIQAVAGLAR